LAGAKARVHLTLAQPARPRVRSARNVIFVEADRIALVNAGTDVIRPVAAVCGTD